VVGLPTGVRRRAVGLRREELAGLAGISVDYLTRLEQGRATSPSAQVVEALARSLRLSDAERELLFLLAGLSAPGPSLVADLRLTATRYPHDTAVRRLVADLLDASPRFVELWNAPPEPAPAEPSRHKTIDHPAVGPIAVECDTLIVAGNDLRIMAYTAEPGTQDAQRLELAITLGTQSLAESYSRQSARDGPAGFVAAERGRRTAPARRPAVDDAGEPDPPDPAERAVDLLQPRGRPCGIVLRPVTGPRVRRPQRLQPGGCAGQHDADPPGTAVVPASVQCLEHAGDE